MVPIPAEYCYNFWDTYDNCASDLVQLTCLMPNGIIILLHADYNATLRDIKEDLWDEAVKFPLYGRLYDISEYIFVYVNCMAEMVKLTDENSRLCEFRPMGGILRITEAKTEKKDETQVGQLIGKRLQEFDSINSPEINNFRFKMRKIGEEIAQSREKLTWQQKVFYQFPPRLCVPPENQYKNIKIAAKFEKLDSSSTFTFDVPITIKPSQLLEMILSKKANIFNMRNDGPCDNVLKVCGRDEFIMGDEPIQNFQYIQDSIAHDKTPVLVTVNVDKVPILTRGDYLCISDFDKVSRPYSSLTLRKKGKYRSSWDIKTKFNISLGALKKLNCEKRTSEVYVGVQVGIFHGGKSLCEVKRTEDIKVNCLGDQFECDCDTSLEFGIEVCNIPKNVKLCFVVYEVTKSTKGGKFKKSKEANRDTICNPIAWGNTTLFDFKSQLRTGAMTLYMWTYAEEVILDDLLNPLGTVVNNPDIRNATTLTLRFESSSNENQIILYPSSEAIIEYARDHNLDKDNNIMNTFTVADIKNSEKLIYGYDNLYEVHDQDRKAIWSLKHYWKTTAPDILPKLLICIDYSTKETFSEVVSLLREWPILPAVKTLELLDYAYADQEVRSYAVQCLQDISDDDLLLYLLQLVQAVKHELFLECDLVNFLLKRALSNQRIGHYLFWHLRSEMQVPSVSVRFGLILEAYCRGTQEHIHILEKQLYCLERFKQANDLIRLKNNKEKAKATLQAYLEAQNTEKMHSVRNPLDPSFRGRKIKADKCRFMDSKMRPLWIVFENTDVFGEDIYVIFKNGDDLRQDMLTLQMLRIMDKLWKEEGLDLRMNAYNCISTENRVGLIEVVLNAETIANIQKEKGTFTVSSAFRKDSIFSWLKDYNPTEASLNNAVNEFTLSCAGYCVATYVLGIGDRHSDNIMIKRTGQLFHIDFGHILGHFKEKFGIKRERVPFVLTHDFVHVINKGQKYAIEFKIFQEICEKAFLILRKHGNLILSLFAMMISTGLPELTSEKDLNYLRDTLVLLKTEEDAVQHFRSKFNEALSNSWKTSLNWASHNLAKNKN